jgi:hypothetical protein
MLLDYYLLKKRISSSYSPQQLESLRVTVLRPVFLRKAIEQGLITDDQAYFFAVARKLFTDLSTDTAGPADNATAVS